MADQVAFCRWRYPVDAEGVWIGMGWMRGNPFRDGHHIPFSGHGFGIQSCLGAPCSQLLPPLPGQTDSPAGSRSGQTLSHRPYLVWAEKPCSLLFPSGHASGAAQCDVCPRHERQKRYEARPDNHPEHPGPLRSKQGKQAKRGPRPDPAQPSPAQPSQRRNQSTYMLSTALCRSGLSARTVPTSGEGRSSLPPPIVRTPWLELVRVVMAKASRTTGDGTRRPNGEDGKWSGDEKRGKEERGTANKQIHANKSKQKSRGLSPKEEGLCSNKPR